MKANNRKSIHSITRRYGKLALLCGVLGSLGACSTTTSTATQTEIRHAVAVNAADPKTPGAYEHVWEEPMVDVVEVPPGVDPEGIYYRPAHQEVTEVRQGRYKYNDRQ